MSERSKIVQRVRAKLLERGGISSTLLRDLKQQGLVIIGQRELAELITDILVEQKLDFESQAAEIASVEREACALVAETYGSDLVFLALANAIRTRSVVK